MLSAQHCVEPDVPVIRGGVDRANINQIGRGVADKANNQLIALAILGVNKSSGEGLVVPHGPRLGDDGEGVGAGALVVGLGQGVSVDSAVHPWSNVSGTEAEEPRDNRRDTLIELGDVEQSGADGMEVHMAGCARSDRAAFNGRGLGRAVANPLGEEGQVDNKFTPVFTSDLVTGLRHKTPNMGANDIDIQRYSQSSSVIVRGEGVGNGALFTGIV